MDVHFIKIESTKIQKKQGKKMKEKTDE